VRAFHVGDWRGWAAVSLSRPAHVWVKYYEICNRTASRVWQLSESRVVRASATRIPATSRRLFARLSGTRALGLGHN
jgi:hypothetical protein